MQDRPKLTLPKRPPPQAEAETQAQPQEQPRPALAERVRAARHQGPDEASPAPMQGGSDADTVSVPAAIFQRMRELAELGQQVEAGAYRPTAEVDQALAAVEQLRQQMRLAMQHRGLSAALPRSPRVEPAAEAEGAPMGTMLAMAAALRRRPRE